MLYCTLPCVWLCLVGVLYEDVACEGDYVQLQCGGYGIRVRSVSYPAPDTRNICPGADVDSTAAAACPTPLEALTAARRVCDGRDSCFLGTNPDAWEGDSCPGALRVQFTCQGGCCRLFLKSGMEISSRDYHFQEQDDIFL
jgi:hypothetical protein